MLSIAPRAGSGYCPRPVTALQIFMILALKGALIVVLTKMGWWPDWEARARKREEHKLVLHAYEQWCERTGTRPAADPRIVDELLAKSNGNVRP
jgi:hypothetical protein